MQQEQESMLFARVTRAQARPGQLEDAVSRGERLLGADRGQAGFRDAYLLVDRRAQTLLAISLWERRDQVEHVAAERQRLGEFTDALAAPPDIAAYQVLVRTARIEHALFARVTSADLKGPAEIEGGVIWHKALPEYQQVAGFQGALLLDAIHSARGMVVTFWENEQAARHQAESGMRTTVLSRFVDVMAGMPTVEDFEVVLQL